MRRLGNRKTIGNASFGWSTELLVTCCVLCCRRKTPCFEKFNYTNYHMEFRWYATFRGTSTSNAQRFFEYNYLSKLAWKHWVCVCVCDCICARDCVCVRDNVCVRWQCFRVCICVCAWKISQAMFLSCRNSHSTTLIQAWDTKAFWSPRCRRTTNTNTRKKDLRHETDTRPGLRRRCMHAGDDAK